MSARSLTTSSADDPGTGAGVVEFSHQPVLLSQVLAAFAVTPAGWIADCTVGGAGHALALIGARPDVSVLGLDRDEDALSAAGSRLAGAGERARTVHMPFSRLGEVLVAGRYPPLAGILADLGVSSHHLDTASRGFSFRHDGPLDMRMDPSVGPPLEALLATVSTRDLARLLRAYGDVGPSGRAAATVLRAWRDGVRGTAELARRIAANVPSRGRVHPATRVFQALRIWVNDELGELRRLLADGPGALAPGGAMVVISFHSGEDRLVKHGFRQVAHAGGFEVLTRKPVSAEPAEVRANPRARSARLRVLRRLVQGEEQTRRRSRRKGREERGQTTGTD